MTDRATFQDILAMSPAPLTAGRQMISVENVTMPGGRARLHVRNDRGEKGEISLGQAATRTRRLRVLLGGAAPGPQATLEELREALVGRSFRVRLTEETYNGFQYLEIRRA